MVEDLRVIVLQGEGAVNNLKTGEITEPVVEVRDVNERPLEGSTVIFRLPPTGPGGLFAQQKTSFQTRTNAQGQAASSRYTLTNSPGKFAIQVTATYENRTGRAVITQTNSAHTFSVTEPKHIRKRWYIIAAVAVGVGGGIGIWELTRSSPPTPGFSVAAGSVIFGAPR